MPLLSPLGTTTDRRTGLTDLEIVVPYTNPALTRAALAHAEKLGAGLHARIRVVRVYISPYPLEIDRPNVALTVLEEQLRTFACRLPISIDVKFARDEVTALVGSLPEHSVVVLASKRRPWRTLSERLCARLRKAGHEVVLCYGEAQRA